MSADGIREALRSIVEWLVAEQIDYCLVGGLALAHWRVVRATADLDFKLRVQAGDYDNLRQRIRSRWPDNPRPELPPHSLVVPVREKRTLVDFLMAVPGYDEQSIDNRVRSRLLDCDLFVCSAEDLIVQKAIADRDIDWLDIGQLLSINSGLNHQYIEEWLTQFAQALDTDVFLKRYRALQNRR